MVDSRSTGSRSRASRYRRRTRPARPELGGPRMSFSGTRPDYVERRRTPARAPAGGALRHSATHAANWALPLPFYRPPTPLNLPHPMSLCFVDPADAIRAISDSIGREARRQLLGEAVRAWGDEIPDSALQVA